MKTWNFFLGCVVLAGCGGDPAPAQKSPDTAMTFEEQATQGQALYASNCASCHGASGEGGPAPRLVGLDKGALPLDPPATATVRKTQFKTVADVANFAVANMPPGKAGSLSADEYLAILAFDLKANGLSLEQPLTLASAATIDIPR